MSQPPVVLVVGSLHHDIMVETDHLPRADETAVGHRWYPKFGGKGGNQAVAAQRAGAQARMFGAVGADAFGDFLLAALDGARVDRRFVRVLGDARSGMSVAIQDATGAYAATIVSGANLRLDARALDDPALWDAVGIVVLQNEIAPEVNLAAALAARARGLTVVLNAAPARALAADLMATVDILVVNAVEAEMLGCGPVADLAAALAAATRLAGRFDTVVVTAGAAGLAARSMDGAQVVIPARKVDVVSSHGAGDCFTGTLAAAMAKGLALEEACRLASDAAAEHVATGGPVFGAAGAVPD
jgi:ribokinase